MLGLVVVDSNIAFGVARCFLPTENYFICSYGMSADYTRGTVTYDCWYNVVEGVPHPVFRCAGRASDILQMAVTSTRRKPYKTVRLSALRSLCC